MAHGGGRRQSALFFADLQPDPTRADTSPAQRAPADDEPQSTVSDKSCSVEGWSLYDVGISSADFQIEIVKQGWLESENPDYDPASVDLCTHGDIRLTIGGETIAIGDGTGEYGISEAALGLLRTLESDTSVAPDQPFADRLIPHGCGTILMMGCPIGIDWTVRHLDGRVRITDVIRHDTTDEAEAQRFPGLAVEISLEEYRDEITAFAQRAKEPFDGTEKSFSDDVDRQDYASFWEEYDRRLNHAMQGSTRSP